MKNRVTRKVVLMCSAVLLGIAVCMLFWLFLREHKSRTFLANSELITERINTKDKHRAGEKNTNENQGDEPLTLEERAERVTQMAKNNFMSTLSEEELARPDIQKRINVYDSPEFLEMVKEHMESGSYSQRKFWKIFESQGVPVDWGAYTQLFRKVFPTGEPEDYEPEMRLELAKLFLAAEPVDPADSRAVLRQGLAVYSKFIKEGDKTFPWLAGRFDIEFDGAIFGNIENNPAFEWVKDVQRNAASIVAAAETAGGDAPETQAAAPSWDMSSVMENPSVSSDTTTEESPSISPPVIDALEPPAISNSAPDVPKALTELPTVEGLETILKSQFSSERFEQAMDTLDRYGPEEGLHRLKENDPEIAKQVERHRNGKEVSQ